MVSRVVGWVVILLTFQCYALIILHRRKETLENINILPALLGSSPTRRSNMKSNIY